MGRDGMGRQCKNLDKQQPLPTHPVDDPRPRWCRWAWQGGSGCCPPLAGRSLVAYCWYIYIYIYTYYCLFVIYFVVVFFLCYLIYIICFRMAGRSLIWQRVVSLCLLGRWLEEGWGNYRLYFQNQFLETSSNSIIVMNIIIPKSYYTYLYGRGSSAEDHLQATPTGAMGARHTGVVVFAFCYLFVLWELDVHCQ